MGFVVVEGEVLRLPLDPLKPLSELAVEARGLYEETRLRTEWRSAWIPSSSISFSSHIGARGLYGGGGGGGG